MSGGGYFQFLEISVFFIHRKLRPMNEKALRAGCAPCGDEVCCKQHRSGAKESQATLCPAWNHNVWRNRVAPRENAPDWKKNSGQGRFLTIKFAQSVNFIVLITWFCNR